MSYIECKVRKVSRKVIGSELTGSVYHPIAYYGTSLTPPTLKEVEAAFDPVDDLKGLTCVWLINTTLSEIENISITEKTEVVLGPNWVDYEKTTIGDTHRARVIVDTLVTGTFAILAYCPRTIAGADKDLILE